MRRDEPVHLSDRDLLLLLDGESPGGPRAHLDSCWTCRERMHALDKTILEFARARGPELDARVNAGFVPGASLRARLAALAGQPGHGAFWRAAPAMVVTVLVIVVVQLNAEGPRPRAALTPGETRPVTLAQVCPMALVDSDRVPESTRAQVFAAYGISLSRRDEYEVDYLITPELGGAGSVRNLWPQPYLARWNAHRKDELESRLHELVCEGKVDLPTAQRAIASDWIGAWRKYVGVRARVERP